MMTATLAARLVEQGVTDWSDPVGALYGDVEADIEPQYAGATLVHFLAHRSGMRLDSDAFSRRMSGLTEEWIRTTGIAGPAPIGFQDGDFTGDPRVDRRHWARAALQEPPVAPLGEPRRIYENGNYVVVASILEHLTDTPYEELMRRTLFEPLGMTGAGFGPPGTLTDAGTWSDPLGHTHGASGVLTMFPPMGPERPDNPPVLSPSGRAHLTAEDVARFMNDHMAGHRGEPALLQPGTYRLLHTPPFGDDYALGWILRDEGGLGHGGTNGKWLAVLEIRPDQDLGVFVATNLGPPEAVSAEVDALVSTLFETFGPGSSGVASGPGPGG